MSYGERLRQALKEASCTQAGLAREVGIRAQAVQYLCNDKAQWSKHTHTIAQLLGVNSRWLASGNGPMRGSGSVVPFRDEETTKLRATIARLEREKQQLLEMLVHARSDVDELDKQTERE